MAVSVGSSFQRSVNLDRDYYGTQDLSSYVVTAKACEVIERMIDSLTGRVAGQAWSITGPYGGGKSAFALFAAHLLRGNPVALNKLAVANTRLASKLANARLGVFCPVLVVGSRESLGHALLRGLIRGMEAFAATYARQPGRPSNKVMACRETLGQISCEAKTLTSQEVSDRAIMDLYLRAAGAVNAATSGGLVILIDELGKLLEYAGLYPERSDLYLLQSLAERASHIGGPSEAPPLLLVTILHQAFDRYAGRLSFEQRDEWRKVQGRFEDISFVEPVTETLRLLSRAVRVENQASLPNDGGALVDELLESAMLPPGVNRDQVRRHLVGALPLHPAVSLIVGPLFRRLAQNKRSLFSFLTSAEPGSFLDVLERREAGNGRESSSLGVAVPQAILYRLDHLYDYLIGAVGAALFNERIGKLWAETEAAVSRLQPPDELSVRCLKQVALLSFVGPLAGLPPTTRVLRSTADANPTSVDAILEALESARLVTYRPFNDEYHIWQGSDFELRSALHEAREQIPARVPLASLISDTVPPSPFVARRHSYRTGATRIFEVRYASGDAWPQLLQEPCVKTDGRIVYVLPEQDDGTSLLLKARKEVGDDPLTLVAIPDGVAALREVVRELYCLKWVRNNATQLQGDDVARRELDQQLADLSGYVEQRIASLFVADANGRNPCTWIYQNKVFRIQNERALQELLSQVCDRVFCDTPVIWNELLNLQRPSSSAVKGLKLLLQAMIDHGDSDRLGIEQYPAEFGMYMSILRASGMHRRSDKALDQWHFGRPDHVKHAGSAAVWDVVKDSLETARGNRLPVQELYAKLQSPPFGVRKGLLPVFLLAVYKSLEDEVAVYESGTFVPKLDFQTIERLLKRPDNFELQYVEIRGARVDVLQSLAPLVGLSASVQEPLPFVVRILERIHGLSSYVRQTTALSQNALNVREAVCHAVEPSTLLFKDLPNACGYATFTGDPNYNVAEVLSFVEALQEALRELGGAYDGLLERIQDLFAQCFRIRSSTADERRFEFAERAHHLLNHATDVRLRAFLVRATDEILDTQSWYESLAALLTQRKPSQWRDEDVAAFFANLREMSRSFSTLEVIAFDVQEEVRQPGNTAGRLEFTKRVRLSVTVQHETEHEHVISVHPEDAALVEQVFERLSNAIASQDVAIETQLAGVAKLSKELLVQREQIYESHD